jgi:hypothetical protein
LLRHGLAAHFGGGVSLQQYRFAPLHRSIYYGYEGEGYFQLLVVIRGDLVSQEMLFHGEISDYVAPILLANANLANANPFHTRRLHRKLWRHPSKRKEQGIRKQRIIFILYISS